jgi:hypothetical protein
MARRAFQKFAGPVRPWHFTAALVLLAIGQFAWLAWFLLVPLPNANNAGLPPGETVRRGLLLLKAFPEVVPDTSWRDSLLGRALQEFSHVQNLPQRFPIVLAAGLIAAAAVGVGDAVLRLLRLQELLHLGERAALDYGIGSALLGVATLILGRLGWLAPWGFRIGLAAAAIVGLCSSRLWRAERSKLDRYSLLVGLLIAPFLLIMVLGSMLPSIDFDVLEYHLEGPKEYFLAGRIAFLPHNVYTSMPFNVEMLHLLGMEVLSDWWWGGLTGQLLVALFAPATALLIASAVRRPGGSRRAAAIAAIVYLSTPWVYRIAVIAYVEGPLCFYHAALVWCAVCAFDASFSRGRLWSLAGLLAGGAMACKYPALVTAVIPCGLGALFVAARARSAAPLVGYLAGWAVVMGPWLGKNVLDTGNPVYPLAYRVFDGRHWDPEREAKWAGAHYARRPITKEALASALVDVAGRSDWQSPLYVVLAPLALLRSGSRRFALALWGCVAYVFFSWWLLMHRIDRFWLPFLPPLALLAGLGADWVQQRGWLILLGTVLAIALVANLTYTSTALAGLNEWTGDLDFLRHDIPRRLNAPLARIDRELPSDARILLVGQAAVFHVDHPIVYNTVFDEETIELLARGQTPDQFRFGLRTRNLTHIYVDWKEIKRHRQPGGYGYTDFVTRECFTEWVARGVLEHPVLVGAEQELYAIR